MKVITKNACMRNYLIVLRIVDHVDNKGIAHILLVTRAITNKYLYRILTGPLDSFRHYDDKDFT